MYVQNWQPREMSWWQDGKAKYLQVLAGEGCLEPSDLGHWQKTTAATLARGEIKQSMKLGKPVMMAAGFAIRSLPPLLRFQTTQQSLHQLWGVLCMGAVQCREDVLLCLCCLQSTSTPSILQEHGLVKIICIISSVRWIKPVETGQFYFTWYYHLLQRWQKIAGTGMACVWHLYGFSELLLFFVGRNLVHLQFENFEKNCLGFWDIQWSCWMQDYVPVSATPLICLYFCPRNCV